MTYMKRKKKIVSKMSKLIPTPPLWQGLKSCPITTLQPMRGGENPRGVKQEGAKCQGRTR